MFQKFYTDTLGGRFIKSLLAQTPVPLFDCVVDGDHLVSGHYYVYRKFIIQCATSGILAVSESEKLYPSDTLFPSVYLFPDTGYRAATFYVKSYLDDSNIKTHAVFKSSTNYYDSETHYYLGKYLRYLYATEGLNLFPYYNVYNSTYFDDVELDVVFPDEVVISRVDQQRHKLVAIPIRFGHTYTVALDCPTQVIMRACIHDNSGYFTEDELSDELLKSALADSGHIYTHLRFDSPVSFRIETSSSEGMMLQHNLYLLIQLPSQNDSSIVVLENYEHQTGTFCNENNVREVKLLNPSLLKLNTKESYAFSNRLLEYLLGNVISDREHIWNNIVEVQTALAKHFPFYARSFIRGQHKKGVWDDDIPRLIQCLVEEPAKNNIIYDQDGNINRDAEVLLYSHGGTHK